MRCYYTSFALTKVRGLVLVHFLRQFAGLHLHAVEGEPLLAKVFDAGTKVIDRLVNA